jgi:hypothetical protein
MMVQSSHTIPVRVVVFFLYDSQDLLLLSRILVFVIIWPIFNLLFSGRCNNGLALPRLAPSSSLSCFGILLLGFSRKVTDVRHVLLDETPHGPIIFETCECLKSGPYLRGFFFWGVSIGCIAHTQTQTHVRKGGGYVPVCRLQPSPAHPDSLRRSA